MTTDNKKNTTQTSGKFDLISRLLHWSMAALFFWQFIGAILHFLFQKGNFFRDFFWNTHFVIGSCLFLLVILRAVWALMNLSRRPPLGSSFLGIAAHLGHLMLYFLMLAVPLLALLRAYGSGRGFAPLGITVFSAGAEQNIHLVALGNNWHWIIGWFFLLMIAGHIGMVFVHRLILKDGLDKRMSFK